MKNNKINYCIAVCIFWFMVVSQVCGQDVSTLRFMRMNPYSNFSNPAYFLPYDAYIGIPALGNTNIFLQNSSLHYDKIFKMGPNNTPQSIMVDGFLDQLKTDNWINLRLNEELLGFGFRLKKNFFSVSYRLHAHGNLNFSDALFKLPFKGNSMYLGEDNPANIDLKLNMNVYQELAIGYQRVINEKLSIGARPKILFGLANIKTNNINAKVYTDASTYDIRLQYGLDANISSITPIIIKDQKVNVDMDAFTSNIITPSFKNIGFGIDLGAEYKITKEIGVAASINDLGFISWKTNNQTVNSTLADGGQFYENGSFYFNGLDHNELQNIINDTAYRRQFVDSLKNYFPIEGKEMGKYSTQLNTNFSVEGYYDLGKMHRFSAVFQGAFYNGAFYPAFTVAYDGNFFKIIDVCVNYTMMKRSYANVGFGVGFNLGIFNIYASTNNILSVFNPLNASQMNAQIGLVFNWGKVTKEDLFSAVPDQKEEKQPKAPKEPKKSKDKTEKEEGE
ncbi:MAG: DUF5723 family protein [Bacteroidales bacterium]|nr:DUF5723 family protein [Bacteroidales bacterium]